MSLGICDQLRFKPSRLAIEATVKGHNCSPLNKKIGKQGLHTGAINRYKTNNWQLYRHDDVMRKFDDVIAIVT